MYRNSVECRTKGVTHYLCKEIVLSVGLNMLHVIYVTKLLSGAEMFIVYF